MVSLVLFCLVSRSCRGSYHAGPVCVGLYTFIMEPLRKKQMPRKERDGGSSDPGFSEWPQSMRSPRTCREDSPSSQTNWTPGIYERSGIGAVYLQKNEAGDISCYHTTCPHAGCSVAYEQDSKAYHCPCHNSSFNLDGSKLENGGPQSPVPTLGYVEIKVDEATNTVFANTKTTIPGDMTKWQNRKK